MPMNSISHPVITLENISIRYRIPHENLSGIKEYTIRWLQRRIQYDEFWALKDVSFQVGRAAIFGIIGQNGAGKSTLLKVMARVLKPKTGRVVIHGWLAPLLELGGGFHPELTGRENIFLNSALLGRSRQETRSLLDEIVAFAEIDEFIDAPLRTYSTGMAARLGFSVATCVRPDILLIDEVLSVGDALFQKKCLDRMYAFRDQGTTIVIVTHSLSTIEGFCDRTLWLADGQIKMIGNPHEVAREYIQRVPAVPEMAEKTIEAPRLQASTPQAVPVPHPHQPYHRLAELEHVYPAAGVLNLAAGSVTCWLQFHRDQPQLTAMLFHSDDSRFVIYADIDPEDSARRIVARAGGNRPALDPFYGDARFPEVTVKLDDSSPYDAWLPVALTWRGYPEGTLALYVGGVCVGQAHYTRQHDNQYRWPIQLAVGIRPAEWIGELIQRHDGTLVELHPQATSPISGSGKLLRGVRVYSVELSGAEIVALAAQTEDAV